MNWGALFRDNPWLMLLIGYMFVSISWSDMPSRSFRSGIKEIVAVLMACLLATERSPRQALQSVLRRTIYVLVPFSLLLIKYYPYMGVVYSKFTGEIQWIGVTLQKNGLGQVCLISIFLITWTLWRRWKGLDPPVGKYQTYAELVLLFMTIWLLKGPSMWAASATAMCSLGAGLISMFTLSWMKQHRIRPPAGVWLIVVAVIMVIGIVTPFVGGSTVTGVTSALGRDSTLTGRTDIWASLMPDISRQPILGYGFSGFWTVTRTIDHQIGEAHNGYLDVCLQLGLVGLGLTGIFILSGAKKALRILETDFDWGCLYYCFVVMVVMESIADSTIDTFESRMMAILLFFAVVTRAAPTWQPILEPVSQPKNNLPLQRNRATI